MKDYYFYAEGLVVGYQGKPIVRDIHIRLRQGEILTLIGPNGAGKSTVLKSIAKQLSPLEGTIPGLGENLWMRYMEMLWREKWRWYLQNVFIRN